MISANNVTLRVGKKALFEDVNIKFTEGNCYGLIGANGAGKSTFLKILSGQLESTSGDVVITPGQRLSFLQQDHFKYDEYPVLDTVIMGNPRLYEVMKEKDAIYMKEDFSDEDGIRAADLEAEFAEMNGWEAESDAANLLNGLGVDTEYHYTLMKDLVGSLKVKVLLAQALFGNPDILLLDEPTNHLDMRSKDVLKEAIREFDGTVILVSHDRDFLDGLATKVYEFGGGHVKEHLSGIYEFLQKKKIENLNELQKRASLSSSPTASAKGSEQEPVQPSENKLSYEAQKELNKKLKKLERQVADCEASIEETEAAISIVEAQMATPEGASDMQLYERHQKLKQQLDAIVEEWERVSLELEDAKK